MRDFLIDSEEETLFENGDIRTGDSDRQNMSLLLQCAKGSFKEFPDATVGASDFLEDEDEGDFFREIRSKFVADGITISKMIMEGGKLKIDASY